MGYGEGSDYSPSPGNLDASISEHQQQHQDDLEKLTLTTQPFKTLKLFILAIAQSLKGWASYISAKGGLPILLGFSAGAAVVPATWFLMTDEPHKKLLEELFRYIQFGLWWMALGVASSIGLGSGLHTFVLYLGPHIALFTIKAMQCGRVDLKSDPYDTIQLKASPSWLHKDCSEFGPPLFASLNGLRVPLSSILPQVQLEAVLWGIGTALGELPPYFISRTARLSGNELETMEELEKSSSKDEGIISSCLKQIQDWFIRHSQYLNIYTILLLASVPNPLFDLAGIMCGQFGVPFWKFFLATMIGKAIIKTHIQTAFIISVCNNQLLNWVENKLIWVLGFIPGHAPILPNMVYLLNAARDKYLAAAPSGTTSSSKKWNISLASIWNTVVWLMLINLASKIVVATAQKYLKQQQQKEMDSLNKLHSQTVSTQ
ncbi:hypothetical protein SAY87_028218 [Trapa incisa]|uniref:Vacuole membrane protein KMS1 n=1 Tax=Trapa incisa TaxID=236973 RepID=A0AAN7KV88_9MYRT|nr:hypothetical protein SAY87_028218 [Trapa incisa]